MVTFLPDRTPSMSLNRWPKYRHNGQYPFIFSTWNIPQPTVSTEKGCMCSDPSIPNLHLKLISVHPGHCCSFLIQVVLSMSLTFSCFLLSIFLQRCRLIPQAMQEIVDSITRPLGCQPNLLRDVMQTAAT